MRSRCRMTTLTLSLSLLLTAGLSSACFAEGPKVTKPDSGAELPPPPPYGQSQPNRDSAPEPADFDDKPPMPQPSGEFNPGNQGIRGGFGKRFGNRFDGSLQPMPRMQQRMQKRFNREDGAMGGGFGGGRGGMGYHALDLRPLNLTEEQKQKIQALRKQTADNMRQVKMSLKEQRMQMKDMMFDPKSTDAQIRLKRQAVRQLQDKMDELQVNDFLKMRGVLTKEQLSHISEVKPQAPQPGFGGQRFGKREFGSPGGNEPGQVKPE